ncbi:protein kinase [Bacillus proteolyticus]|uniref:protein kinase n=1 Tax=Bacillus proteolyticus TaxID=2026192 RepID=UPI003D08170D
MQWCNKLIEASDSPPYEIIEISLMSKAKIDDIEGKLFEFSSTVDEEYTVKLTLSVIHKKLKKQELTIEESIKCTTRLLVNRGLYWEAKYFDLYSLDDSYDLAKDGVHFDLSEVINTYVETLGVYSKYFRGFEKLYFKVMKNEWVR